MDPITGPLADVLRRNREKLNARFAAASKAAQPIDAEEFHRHLAETVEPIARSVADEFAERTDDVVEALFELSLDLFRQNLLGPNPKYPVIPEAWRELLPRIPRFVANEPARVAGAVTNALYHLSRTAGTRPREWCDARLFAACRSVDEFLDCGLILAWRCGMPQYRQPAIDKARALPVRLAAQTLGLPPNTQPEALEDVLRNLAANPWCLPQNARGSAARQLKIVGQAGAFRGFGGQFLLPPKVHCVAGELRAVDGDTHWRLVADAYNAILQRCEPASPTAPSDAQINGVGVLQWQGLERQFPALSQSTGIASTRDTVAVTIATSHHVFLLGLA